MRKSYVIAIGVLLFLLLIMLFLITNQGSKTESTSSTPRQSALEAAPESAGYTTVTGEPINLENIEADYVLVYSWASWCASCGADLALLNDQASQWNSAGRSVSVIAINRAESPYTAQQYLNTLPALGSIEVVLDADDQLFSVIEGYVMPEYVLYDKTGNIVMKGRALLELSEIDDLIQ